MDDGSNDESAPVLTIGQRIQHLRERKGMPRRVLAGLLGKSESWLKQVETGVIQQDPRLAMLVQVAEILRCEDLAEITGGQSIPLRAFFVGPGHAALGPVRDAINAMSLVPTGTVQPLANLRARLDSAWRLRHASPDHRTALGAILPDLIRDAELAGAMYRDADRRRAMALVSEVYGLAQMFLAYQPAADLLWRVADRAVRAAQESEDPLAIAYAVWFLTQAHRDSGDLEAALDVNRQGMTAIAAHVDDAGVGLRAMWGALTFELAYTYSRLGGVGDAWLHWQEAARVAERLPATYYQPVSSFSQVIMKAHAVTLAVELHQGGESARQADGAENQPIPSRPRRGRHLIETARAHLLQRDHAAVLGILEKAQIEAPETIKYNGYARRMILEASDGPKSFRPRAKRLADRIGLMV